MDYSFDYSIKFTTFVEESIAYFSLPSGLFL